MSEATDKALCYSVARELETYDTKQALVCAELSPQTVIKLIGLLQLVSRHPNITERDHEFVRGMVENLAKGFKPEHTAIAELIRQGWKQEFDQELSA